MIASAASKMLRLRLWQIKKIDKKTDETRNRVCKLSVIMMVFNPPREV